MSRFKTSSKTLRKHTKKYVEDIETRNTELQTVIDDMSDHIIKAENKLKQLTDAFTSYYDNYQTMKEFINDLAYHGVRFDTRPTLYNIEESDLNVIKDYYSYIQRIDSSIRTRAKDIMGEIDRVEKEKGL